MAKITLQSATSGPNPDIVIKHRFDPAKAYYVGYLVDHNGKDKTVTDITNDHDVLAEELVRQKGEFNDYVEYTSRSDATALEEGVADELTPTFNQASYNLTKDDLNKLRDHVNVAAQNHNLMWKTVVSFSDDFLIREKLMDNAVDRNIDQRRIKEVIRQAMPDMLKAEGIENTAEWFADIHLHGDRNKNHVHVHIATFEQITARPAKFNPVTHRNEPRGVFKQRTIDKLKSNIWRDMRLTKNREHEVELLMQRDTVSKELLKKVADTEFVIRQTHLLNTLMRMLPDEAETKWRAKSNAVAMKAANAIANDFINSYLDNDENGQQMLHEFLQANIELSEIYKQGMGENEKTDNYVQDRRDKLQEQLVNRLYETMRHLDPSMFVQNKTKEINETPLEENKKLKDLLEIQVKQMQEKGQPVPKAVAWELGKRKAAIKLANLAGKQAIVQARLDYQKTFNATDNLDLLATHIDDPLIAYMNNQLGQMDQLLTLQQQPNYKKLAPAKDKQKALEQFFIDVSEMPISYFSPENIERQLDRRKKELDLVLGASAESVQLAYGLPDLDVDKKDVVKRINQEIGIITNKGEIFNNNELLKDTTLSSDQKQNLKKQNANLFGKIAELEGRENKFKDYEKNRIEEHNKNVIQYKKMFRKRPLLSFAGARRIMNNLSYELSTSEDRTRQVEAEHDREVEKYRREMGWRI